MGHRALREDLRRASEKGTSEKGTFNFFGGARKRSRSRVSFPTDKQEKATQTILEQPQLLALYFAA